jgi:hypothetical protein
MGDYVSTSDPALATWLYEFITALNLRLDDLGLLPADVTPLQTAYTSFGTSVSSYSEKRNAMNAASSLKKDNRVEVVDILRPLVGRIQHAPGMTNEIRSELGLPPKGARTTHSVRVEVPALFLEGEPGFVYVHFGTDPTNERINSRASWAQGCNIYRKRAGDAEFALVAFQKASPYVDRITGNATDYVYMVAYRGNRADQVGGQSAESMIAARGGLVAA